MPDLLHLLDTHKISVAALYETRLNNLDNPALANYNIFTNNRNRHGGGVAILIDKKFRFSYIHEDHLKNLCIRNNVELILGKIWISTNNILYICSVYSPPRGGNYPFTEPRAWQEIFQYCSGVSPIIICDDFDGKSPLWSNLTQGPDNEGQKLESAISNSNLCCLNNGDITWSSSDLASASSLDITVTSPNNACKCDWHIMECNHGNDHFPIVIRIDEVYTAPNFGRPSFSTSQTDWPLFQKECIQFAKTFTIDTTDLEATYNLTLLIHQALSTAGATRHQSNKQRKMAPAPWWDDNCHQIIRNKNKIFRDYKKSPTILNLQRYFAASKDASKAFAKKKKEFFRNFCSSLDINTPITNV